MDEGTPPEQIAGGGSPADWTPDGRTLIAWASPDSVAPPDIWQVNVGDRQQEYRPVIQSAGARRAPALSPDGRLLAYVWESDVEALSNGPALVRPQVYVQPYPGPGQRVQVSVDGGSDPAWHPNGRELFFLGLPDDSGSRSLMAVDVRPGPTLQVGRPRRLFEFRNTDLAFANLPVRGYDVSPDGQRFFVTQAAGQASPPPVTQINLIQNWFEELKAKVPAGR